LILIKVIIDSIISILKLMNVIVILMKLIKPQTHKHTSSLTTEENF